MREEKRDLCIENIDGHISLTSSVCGILCRRHQRTKQRYSIGGKPIKTNPFLELLKHKNLIRDKVESNGQKGDQKKHWKNSHEDKSV